MAKTNLNPEFQIRIYDGFAIITDLRKTGIAKMFRFLSYIYNPIFKEDKPI